MTVTDIEAFVGTMVRHYRKTAGMTQDDLADKTSLGRTSITNIEKGRQAISLRTLQELADALNIEIQLLLPPATPGGMEQEIWRVKYHRLRRKLMNLMDTLDGEDAEI